MNTTVSNDINQLDPGFKKKFDLWWADVIAKYPNARVFEAKRSLERQKRLYASGRTRPGNIITMTLHSNHLLGKAVDVVFMVGGQPKREGPYDDLIEMAKKYGIKNLKPFETCHFEDDGKPLVQPEKLDPLLQRLIDDGIWNGQEGEGITKRVALMIAKAKYN